MIASCSSSKKENEEIQASATSDSSAATDLQNAQTTPAPIATPAPGSVRVKAEIVSFESTSKGFHCDLKIVTVLKYGASTPPLSEEAIITALVTSETLQAASQNANQDADEAADEDTDENAKAEKILADKNTKEFTLKYQQAPDLPGLKSTSWRIVSIR